MDTEISSAAYHQYRTLFYNKVLDLRFAMEQLNFTMITDSKLNLWTGKNKTRYFCGKMFLSEKG